MSKSHSDYMRDQELLPLGKDKRDNYHVLHGFVTDALDGAVHVSSALEYGEVCALAERAFDLGRKVAMQEKGPAPYHKSARRELPMQSEEVAARRAAAWEHTHIWLAGKPVDPRLGKPTFEPNFIGWDFGHPDGDKAVEVICSVDENGMVVHDIVEHAISEEPTKPDFAAITRSLSGG